MDDAPAGEPAVGPAMVGSGLISPGDTKATHGDTAGIRTLHFNRTFMHYINNSAKPFATYDYDPVEGALGEITMKHASLTIPYQYLNSAMTAAEIETHLMPATCVFRVRVSNAQISFRYTTTLHR